MTAANPITRISAAGDPYDIGQALGRAVGSAVRERVFITSEFQGLAARWRGSDRLGALEFAARGAFPRIVREIEGLAAGADLDFETVFLWNCRGDLRLPRDGAEAEGCTCVLLPADDNRPAVIAHNEDGAPEFLGHCYWVDVTPDIGPAFQSFMYPGMLPGHTFGMNGAGLVQTINNVRAHDLQPGIPRQVITRAILGCDSVDAALALLNRRDRASGFHHALGEAGSMRVVSVEAPASGCHAEEIGAPAGHANHLVYATFRDTPQDITESSRLRQQRTAAPGAEPEPEIILFDKDTPVYRANDTGDDYAQTLATAVFRLFADRVDWAVHATPTERRTLSGSVALAG